MGLSFTDRQKVVERIGKAIRHAERISRRLQLERARAERINQFVVSLRRELLRLESEVACVRTLESLLTNQSMWDDIGVLKRDVFSMRWSNSFTGEEVASLVRHAKMPAGSAMVQREEIEGDLEELAHILAEHDQTVADMAMINEEGEAVAASLDKLFE